MILRKKIREESVLILQVEKKDWIIDSGCSHHMTSDIRKFVKLRSNDGRIVKVGNNVAYHITRIGSITVDGKTNNDDVFFFYGLKQNLLSGGQLMDKGYQLQFGNDTCIIKDKKGKLLDTSTRTIGNVF